MAMTDGILWHQAKTNRPWLVITANHTAVILPGTANASPDAAAWEIIGGRQILVKNGRAVEYTNTFAQMRNPSHRRRP